MLWLESKKIFIKESTFCLYKYCVEKYIAKKLGKTEVSKFSRGYVQKILETFAVNAKELNLKPSTAKKTSV